MMINTKLNSALSNQRLSEILTLTKTSNQTQKKRTRKVEGSVSMVTAQRVHYIVSCYMCSYKINKVSFSSSSQYSSYVSETRSSLHRVINMIHIFFRIFLIKVGQVLQGMMSFDKVV